MLILSVTVLTYRYAKVPCKLFAINCAEVSSTVILDLENAATKVQQQSHYTSVTSRFHILLGCNRSWACSCYSVPSCVLVLILPLFQRHRHYMQCLAKYFTIMTYSKLSMSDLLTPEWVISCQHVNSPVPSSSIFNTFSLYLASSEGQWCISVQLLKSKPEQSAVEQG